MKKSIICLLALTFLCACNTIGTRQQEKSAAFASLSAAERDLVNQGRIEKGMDTNAVYIAWGKPSIITNQASTQGPGVDQLWIYYGSRPVVVPGWTYLPDANGYSTLEYQPNHHAERYTKAEVLFHDDRVVHWIRY